MIPELDKQAAQNLIAAESFDSMVVLATRYVFGDPPPPTAFLHLMIRIQTIQLTYGVVTTTKLVDVVQADLEIGTRQAYRYYRAAVDAGWILAKRRKTRGDGSDNRHNPEIRFAEKMQSLHDLRGKVTQIVALQHDDPFNLTAGAMIFDDQERGKIYMHPL